MRTIQNTRGNLVTLGILATVSLAACTAHAASNTASPRNSQTGGIPAASSPVGPTAAASAPAATPSATPTAPGSVRSVRSVQNLVITSDEKSDLTAAFVAVKGISLSDVDGGGPIAGSVYYAYDPATGAYWALAEFEPSATASSDVKVNFQDGGGMGMFRRAGGGVWRAQIGAAPSWWAECRFFPLPVLAAWSIQTNMPDGLGC